MQAHKNMDQDGQADPGEQVQNGVLLDEHGGQADEDRQKEGPGPKGWVPLAERSVEGGQVDGHGLVAVETGEYVHGAVAGVDQAA